MVSPSSIKVVGDTLERADAFGFGEGVKVKGKIVALPPVAGNSGEADTASQSDFAVAFAVVVSVSHLSVSPSKCRTVSGWGGPRFYCTATVAISLPMSRLLSYLRLPHPEIGRFIPICV